MKPPRCKHCRERTERPGQVIHSECIDGFLAALKAKEAAKASKEARARAKVDRAQTRAKREQMASVPELIKAADKAFAAFIRTRDRLAGYPCISSGRLLDWSGNQVDAGHYRSRGAASHLRYHEDNCHAQSKHDNQFKAGNVVEYRIRLVQRIGLERVEALESDNGVTKWTKEGLREIAATYKAKCKELNAGEAL